MPRVGRVVVPNYPHHIVQRGHNKQVVFAEEADLRHYLSTLENFKNLYDVKVFRFCLMTIHVHLTLQPGEASEFGWLDLDLCFDGLGNTDDERATRYREFVKSAVPPGEWELIYEAVQRGQLTGNERFSDEVKATIGRRIENRKPRRPKKVSEKQIHLLFRSPFPLRWNSTSSRPIRESPAFRSWPDPAFRWEEICTTPRGRRDALAHSTV